MVCISFFCFISTYNENAFGMCALNDYLLTYLLTLISKTVHASIISATGRRTDSMAVSKIALSITTRRKKKLQHLHAGILLVFDSK